MTSWYEFKAKTGKETEILLYGEIGGFGISASSFLAELQTVPEDHRLVLRIHSAGGSVLEGTAIANAIRRHPGGVTTHVDGLAASMASMIAIAGAPAMMASNGWLVIHNVTAGVNGDAEDMRRMADLTEKINDSLVSAYAKRTKKPAKEIEEMMDEETWLNAKEAKAHGFIDEITGEMQMAAKFDLSKFKHAPAVDTTATGNTSGLTFNTPAFRKLIHDAMTIETPEFLALKSEHQTLAEQHKALVQSFSDVTEQHKLTAAKLADTEKLVANLKTALEKVTADAVATAAKHTKELGEFNDKVGKAALALLAQNGTQPVKLGTDNGIKGSIVEQLNAIEDTAERTAFYREHRKEILASRFKK